MMADKMTETFGKHVIFIPSIGEHAKAGELGGMLADRPYVGNNDIWREFRRCCLDYAILIVELECYSIAHNILEAGPSSITNEFTE